MSKKTPAELRSVFDDAGVTFADCVTAFAAPEDDVHVAAARQQYAADEISFDDWPVTSRANEDACGSFVMAWVWVPDPEVADGDSLAMPLDETPA